MAQSVLGSLTLGYRPLWDRARSLAGVQLFVHEDRQRIDGRHLLRTLAETWGADSPTLLLSIQTPEFLSDVVGHAEAGDPMLEIPLGWMQDPALRPAVRAASRRGVRMLASGVPAQLPDAEAAPWFQRRLLRLEPEDAMDALRLAQMAREAAAIDRSMARPAERSPVRADVLVDGVASRALAEHALDQQNAWAVAGWPCEDILHSHGDQPLPPTRRGIVRVMNAIDAEESLERIDQLVSQEAALVYALMLYLNSPGLGLPSRVASLRHGFMLIGFQRLNAWLSQQMPIASEDPNLRPLNASMVMRGHLVAQLMDAGIEDDLRREVYLCGLFSQLDLVMGEPLRTSFARIPLAERIVAATIAQTGPYAPALQLAVALESSNPTALRDLRRRHGVDAEEINRALLRMLASGLR